MDRAHRICAQLLPLELSRTTTAAESIRSQTTSSSNSTTSTVSKSGNQLQTVLSDPVHTIEPPPPSLTTAASGNANATANATATANAARWNGWGFNDTEFALNAEGLVQLQGNRYLFSGKVLPNLRSWLEEKAGLDVSCVTQSQMHPSLPPPTLHSEWLNDTQQHCAHRSTTDEDRLFHAHGHTVQEIYMLRFAHYERVPDIVVWPGSHAHVQALVDAAHKHNVVLIPFGGGTSVSQALLCPTTERRMIVSVDMRRMSRVAWISQENQLACIEAGCIGRDLEAQLARSGLVLGHEPDSIEFSSMGGWCATRASGMRKNKYGNIEDIVVSMKFATCIGTIEKSCSVPRLSTGPDIHHMMLGSEGTLGIITECTVKVKRAPQHTVYGSIIFPSFEQGVALMCAVAKHMPAGLKPVSIRLVDNMQFQFGQALKPDMGSDWKTQTSDQLKKWYVTKVAKYDVNTMCAATLLFEGDSRAEIRQQETALYRLARQHGGMKAGSENGVRGYFLTYMIAYLRDFGLNYSFMGESFETSIPFDSILTCCAQVKQCIADTAQAQGVRHRPFVSCRVTQLYDTGVCIYFYFGFIWSGLPDPLHVFEVIETAARDTILQCGGSLSHHHGVGKLRQKWLERQISPGGCEMLRAVKQRLDPKNVFGCGNLVRPQEAENKQPADSYYAA